MSEWQNQEWVVYVRHTHGASPDTLLRRAKYGGRKGRAARRQLGRCSSVKCGTAFMLPTP